MSVNSKVILDPPPKKKKKIIILIKQLSKKICTLY